MHSPSSDRAAAILPVSPKDIGQSDDGLQRSVLSSFLPLKHAQARFLTPFLKATTKALTKLVRGFEPGLENKRKHLCICEEVSVAFALYGLMVAELKR